MTQSYTQSVLVVDDDQRLCAMISDYLTNHGYQVNTCYNGDDAIHLINEYSPDLVILDLMLPGTDGLSVCREVRASYRGKILMLTALDEVTEEITGLEIGADDYMTKPVSPRLLLARIRSLLRRVELAGENSTQRVILGDLIVDSGNREVTLNDQPIRLTTAEFDLLWILAQQAGQSVQRDTLHETLFRLELTPDDRRIDLIVSRIRKKLGDNPVSPRYLKTVRGMGYLLGTGR